MIKSVRLNQYFKGAIVPQAGINLAALSNA